MISSQIFSSSDCEINPSLPQTHAAIFVQIAAVDLSIDRARNFFQTNYAHIIFVIAINGIVKANELDTEKGGS
jgi:hypothetical protein